MKKNIFLFLLFLSISTFANAQITNPTPYCNGSFDDMDGFLVDDAINSVSIGTLTNATNAQYAAPHYVFYNNLTAPSLTKGTSYTLTVKFDVKGGCGYGVWIDYNQNNTFEATEKVAGTTSGNLLDMTTNTIITQSVLIPVTATTGNTRMRVRIVEDDTYNMDNNYVIAACNVSTSATDVMDWGETEDYVVNIASSAGCTPVAITTQPTATQSACAPGGASFTVAAATGTAPITYQWQYNNSSTWSNVVNGTPAGSIYTNATTATLTVAGITAAATYQYRCYLTNCSGANNATSNTASLVVNAKPTAPTVGTITQPTCASATGSLVLSGLPATGTWTLTRTPGTVTTTGTGTSSTITGLTVGTYTYTVTNASTCVSTSSANVVINAQPAIPTAPTVGTITQPTCATATGSVLLNGLPATGTWTLTRTPGTITTTGTGTTSTITGLANGTYTYTVTNASTCVSTSSTNVVINAQPATPTAPTVGAITQPTCASSTGSVVLSGLPATGTWTLTRTPGAVTTTGTGTTSTITGLAAGTYTYTVINASTCVSTSSANVVINAQPATPTAPTVGTITQPTCASATGSVVLNGLPTTGAWTLVRTPGAITTTGTGTTSTITGLAAGTYTYTVTNASTCVSTSSANVFINAQPATPTAPTVGTITQPTCATATGSVVLNGLPATGTWTLTRTPGTVTTTGTGTNSTITGLTAGTYTYTVTNSSTCVSTSSSNVVINTVAGAPTAPTVGTITQPTCATETGSVVLNDLPATGTWTLTRTPGAVTTTGTGTTSTITGLAAGTYTYTVTNASTCISSSSANIVIDAQPAMPTAPIVGTIAQPTCASATGSVVLNGLPTTGTWTLTCTPGGTTTTGTGTISTITGLATGTYTYTVTNASTCISSSSANIVIDAQPVTPIAQYTYTSNGLTVTFSNTSVGATSYSWDIGGFVSNDVNPIYSFPSNGQYAVVLTANNQGCTSTYTQTITISGVGIETAEMSDNLMVYPNPTTGMITIQLNGQVSNAKLFISDMMGRVVFQKVIREIKESLDLTSLSPGIYELQINNENKTIHQRIVIHQQKQ